MKRAAHRAAILHFPDSGGDGPEGREYWADGILTVEDGRVVEVGAAADILSREPDVPLTRHENALIVPGFVDCHVHFPQVDAIAGHGEELLQWLSRHAFPAEMKFADPQHCVRAAELFLDLLLASGTTAALVFSTVHPGAADALFAAAHRRRMRIISGKTMMDRNAPPALLDSAESSAADSLALMKKWHGRGRLEYAVTPRFALTSSEAQLAAAGRVLAENPAARLHTHLSENRAELARAAEMFPEDDDYLAVYERFGLVGERSLFAHAIHLSDGEWDRIAAAGAAVAFCPCSNLFLGSGLFNAAAARARGVRRGFGSDVGGGDSFFMPRVMNNGYKAARMRGDSLSPAELWKTATIGGARALGLGDRIGNFDKGKEADFAVLDLGASPILRRRLSVAEDLDDALFALAMLADERAAREVYILGERATPDFSETPQLS